MPSRIEMLRLFMQQRPADPFPHYALAMEYKNSGDLATAWTTFESLMLAHAGYTPAYLHAGNTLVTLGRVPEAKMIYARGVEVATKAGDAHARGELEGALASVSSGPVSSES